MSSPSPYGPDRSFFHAVVVLVGGLVVAAGGFYLLSTLGGNFAQLHTSRLTDVRYGDSRGIRGPAVSASRFQGARGVRRGVASPDPFGSRAPTWADNGARHAPVLPPSTGGYDLNADLGHAQLGPVPQGGAVRRGRSGSIAPTPKQPAPPVADLGSSYRSSSSATGRGWQSELSQLGGRLRALDGALARLDRSGEGAAASSRSSGDRVSTASGPHTSSRDVPSPPSVPIDDHVHWLLAAGLLWGAWRLWRG